MVLSLEDPSNNVVCQSGIDTALRKNQKTFITNAAQVCRLNESRRKMLPMEGSRKVHLIRVLSRGC